MTSVPKASGTIFSDDFGGPNYWEYTKASQPADMEFYYPFNSHSFTIDALQGNPEPSARIAGLGYATNSTLSRTIDISGIDRSRSLFVGVDFKTANQFTLFTTTPHINIKADDGASIYSEALDEGRFTGFGWQSFSHDISQLVGDSDSVTVELSVSDDRLVVFHGTYLDNFYLGHDDPLLLNGVVGASLEPASLKPSMERLQELEKLKAVLEKDPRDLTYEERLLVADLRPWQQ